MASELFDNLAQQVPSLLSNKFSDLSLIYIFGSQVSGTVHQDSDVDIAVLCGKKIAPLTRWNVSSELAEVLKKDVDLVDLLEASTVMQHQIIFNGLCIYDPFEQQVAFEMQVMSMYQHLNAERDEIVKEYIANE
jgi:predicted nucleotidyltransferase